jgi:hypothetical protein
MARLAELLDELEDTAGPPGPPPATDGWLLVLAENIAYLVDDERRPVLAMDANAMRVLVRLAPRLPSTEGSG